MNKKLNQNHLDYWSGRSDEIFRYLDRKDIDFFAELNKIYQEQANEMQKDFYDFVSKYSESGSMSYQEALQRLKGTDLSDYRENARKYREQAEKDPELLKRLNEQYASSRATRLDALQLDMLFRAGVARGLIADKFESYLQKMALMGYKKAMSGRTGTINEPALKELVKTPFNGYNYSQQLWGNTDNLVKDLKKILKTGFVRGDHPRTMARDLAQKYKVANSRAETLVRTDGTMIVNRAAIQRYKDAGLKYYRILVHLDNRTTEICKRIHAEDKRYLIDEMQVGVNAPPFHFNCRSGVIPDEEELENWNARIDKSADEFEHLARNKDSNKRKPINIVRQNMITKNFRQRGGIIYQNKDSDEYLKKIGAAALNYDDKTIVLQTKPTISEVLEELYHAEQHRKGEIDPNDPVSKIRAEIAAQKYLLSVEKRYNIPRSESEQTKKNLKYWKEELKKYED